MTINEKPHTISVSDETFSQMVELGKGLRDTSPDEVLAKLVDAFHKEACNVSAVMELAQTIDGNIVKMAYVGRVDDEIETFEAQERHTVLDRQKRDPGLGLRPMDG